MRNSMSVFLPFVVLAACYSQADVLADQDVYVYPFPIKATDKLTDGPNGDPITLERETTLVWVDIQPGFRFAHPSLYFLVSSGDGKVVKGNWWPELNGKRILSEIATPVRVGVPGEPVLLQVDEHVHVCPNALRRTTKLSDGAGGIRIELQGETTLLWIDLQPGFWFAHPTLYLLISGGEGKVVKGRWWPEANGKAIPIIVKRKIKESASKNAPETRAKATVELCSGRYSGQQVSETVVIFANGTHPTSGYDVCFEELPLDVFPPEFRLMHVKPSGLGSEVVTPFSVNATFKAKESVKEVVVHDAAGKHTLVVEQVPKMEK